MAVLAVVSVAAPRTGVMTDSRDGKKYKTVTIGSLIWMAENMAFNTKGSICFVDVKGKKDAGCKKYGRYYTVKEAVTQVCPEGWHVPSYNEFVELFQDAVGQESVSFNLKSKKGWNSFAGPSGNGNDLYGFAAVPTGGCTKFSEGEVYCIDAGNYAYFWTSTARVTGDQAERTIEDIAAAIYAYIGAPHTESGFDEIYKLLEEQRFPVRCVMRDEEESSGVLHLLSQQTEQQPSEKTVGEDDGTQKFAKDIDKVLEDVIGLQTTGKTVLGGRRGKADGGSNEGYAEGGAGGIGDGFEGLFSGNGEGKINKSNANVYMPSPRGIKVVGGSRSEASIMRTVYQRSPGLRHIYNKFLKRKPDFSGGLSLEIVISPDGKVVNVLIKNSTTDYAEFDNQVKTAVSRWTFEAGASDRAVVTIPLMFFKSWDY